MSSKYLAVNICFVGDLFTDKETAINKMIRGGLYRYAMNLKNMNLSNAVSLCLYDHLSNKSIPFKIARKFSQVEVYRDECFVGSSFIAPDEVTELFENSNNSELFEYAKMVTAINNMGISVESLLHYIPDCRNVEPTSPIVAMVNKSKLFEFRNENKTEFELMQFACYIAIKSILGRNRYAKTNIQYVLSRALPDGENEAQNALRIKYGTRRKFESIMQALELSWGVKRYSYFMRGFYIATDSKVTLEQLAVAAESSKKKNKVIKLKNQKQSARRFAIENVKNMYR